MVNIIIAEDEIIPRKALVKMLSNNSKQNCNIIADVGTGAMVLPYLTEKSIDIDIVIADIRMPDMDGLELAKYIHDKYSGIDTILLTAYTNFEYAKSALKYGVKDYLVKPVNEDELFQTIDRLMNSKASSVEFMKSSIEGGIHEFTLENLEFSRILKNPSFIENIVDVESITNKSIYLAVCQTQMKQSQDQVAIGKQLMNQILKGEQYQLLYFRNEDEYIVIYYGNQRISKHKYDAIARAFYEKIGQALHVGISQSHNGENGKKLEAAYKEAVYSINKRILHPETPAFEYNKELSLCELISKDYEFEFKKDINEGNIDKIMNHMQSIYDQCVGMENGIYTLYLAIIWILRNSYEVYRVNTDDIPDFDDEKYQIFSFKSDLYHIKSKEELFSYLFHILSSVSHSCGNEAENINIIEDIVNYVNYNYQYDISLNQLAVHKYYMNPSYLSRLFKQVTGKNFSKYLIELRMEKAKGMLKNDSIKISEIASYVGYNDLSNFIQTFKKYYHITPSQLRRSND